MSLSTALGALLFFAAAVMPPQTSPTNPMAEPKARFWTSAEYRIVPVRVHLMRDTITPAAGTTLSIADIARIFGKANGIWHAAGVELRIESVLEEKPAALGEYEHQGVLPIVALPALRPADTRPEGMFHVYYIGAMPPNGIFMRSVGIFVKESAELHKVPGGIDEPLPRVSAHELGHGMGLPHRQDTTNLMASGTTGTSLNAAEIESVRRTLSQLKWVETPETCRKNADALLSAGKKEEALSRYRALLDLPGDRKATAELASKIQAAVGKDGNGAAGLKKGRRPDARP